MTSENTMKKTLSLTVAAAVLAVTGTAHAHDAVQPAYGGHVGTVGDLHVEFAVRDGGVRAWVRDHADQPLTAAGGKAVLLTTAGKLELPLVADGTTLTADAPVKAGDKVAAVLSLTVGGKAVSARFAQDAVVTPPLAGPAKTGAAAFADNCATCHGTALRGSDAGPPLLHPYYAPGAGHGDEVIVAAITNGAKSHHWKFGDMPKPEGLVPGQEKDIEAYVRAMQAANGIRAAAPMDHSAHGKH